MKASEILPEFHGTAVYDCWAPYFKYENVCHSLCCAHILRELTGIYENHGQEWANELIKLLVDTKDMKDKLIDKGENAFSKNRLDDFH
ncbi:MAG: transposase [Eubacteriales bacterium]|nr:transposase [Eubacteriales bacterium]